MSKPMRVLILQVAMLLLAAPVLAKAAPGRVANEDADRATNVYAKADDVDCSKLKDDDARKQCREAKLKNNDTADVECNKLKDDDARKQCCEAKLRTTTRRTSSAASSTATRPASSAVKPR